MDKILDKLGIYDLVAVLLSGMIMTSLTIFFYKRFISPGYLKIEYVLCDMASIDLIIYLIVSYLVGTVFQELGSLFIKYCVDKNDRLLRKTYNEHKDTKLSISLFERSTLESYLKKYIAINPNATDVYNYCRYILLLNDKMKKADRHQYISAQGRSLSIYFFILFCGFVLNGCLTSKYINFLEAIICLFISLLMLTRCIRFIRLRYVEIFRKFCYEIKNNEDELHKES